MNNLIFNLLLPCEVETKFNLINHLVNKIINFVSPCGNEYTFENNDLTELSFEYICSSKSFSTIYFITSDNELFELAEHKLLTIQKQK